MDRTNFYMCGCFLGLGLASIGIVARAVVKGDLEKTIAGIATTTGCVVALTSLLGVIITNTPASSSAPAIDAQYNVAQDEQVLELPYDAGVGAQYIDDAGAGEAKV